MFRSIVVLVGGLASLGTVPLFAQEAVLGQEYGAGVHAFFAGDYAGAYEQLSAAIQGGSKDPRAFYFRGLACLNLGRGPDAAIDFRKGADLESGDVNRFYDVGKALERVQGEARTELEKYRVAARMAALETAEKIRKQRYEAIQREESRVLREQAKNAPPSGEEVVPPPAAEEGEDNPFAIPGETSKPKKAGKKSAKAPADGSEEDNPFGTDEPEKKPKKPADKGKKSAEKKKTAEDDDPFAEPKSPEKKPDDKGKKPGDEKKSPSKPDEKKPGDEKKSPSKPDEKKPGDEKKSPSKPDEKKPGDGKKKPDEKKPDPGKKTDPADPFAP